MFVENVLIQVCGEERCVTTLIPQLIPQYIIKQKCHNLSFKVVQENCQRKMGRK